MQSNPTHECGDAAARLRNLKALVLRCTDSDWGREDIADVLAQDPGSSEATCPRFAGIVEESGDRAVILAETEAELAQDMAGRLTNEIPIRPTELVDLDTCRQALAFCEVSVHFIESDDHMSADAVSRTD